jgi:hypothetical protein
MGFAEMHVCMAHLSPFGENELVACSGTACPPLSKDALAGRFDPILTMKADVSIDNLAVNIGGKRQVSRRNKIVSLKPNPLTIINPTLAESRSQVTAILHELLVSAEAIKEQNGVPWEGLANKLSERILRLEGWPNLNHGFDKHEYWNTPDIKAILGARQ